MILSHAQISSRGLMDKISVCGTGAPGSIPGGSTIRKTPSGVFLMVLPRNCKFRPGIEDLENIARSEASTI